MGELKAVVKQETRTVTTWAWSCSECGTDVEKRWQPRAPYLCDQCTEKKKQEEGWWWWSAKYPELVGARLVGGVFDYHDLEAVILETEDGRKARIEMESGWERGEEELVVEWENE